MADEINRIRYAFTKFVHAHSYINGHTSSTLRRNAKGVTGNLISCSVHLNTYIKTVTLISCSVYLNTYIKTGTLISCSEHLLALELEV